MATPAQIKAQLVTLGELLVAGPAEEIKGDANRLNQWMSERLDTIKSVMRKDEELGGGDGQADFNVALAQFNRPRGFEVEKAPDDQLSEPALAVIQGRHDTGIMAANKFNRKIATGVVTSGIALVTAIATGGATSPLAVAAVLNTIKTAGELILEGTKDI